MTGFELVAGVIGIFFATGVTVGVLVAFALGSFRRHDDRGYLENRDWPSPPPPSPPVDDEKPPWWQDG